MTIQQIVSSAILGSLFLVVGILVAKHFGVLSIDFARIPALAMEKPWEAAALAFFVTAFGVGVHCLFIRFGNSKN